MGGGWDVGCEGGTGTGRVRVSGGEKGDRTQSLLL